MIHECEFSLNIAAGALIQVSSDFIIPTIYSNGVLVDHSLTHIQIVSCVFSNNTGDQATLVFTYTQDLQNIEVKNCFFIGLVATGDGVLTMTSPTTMSNEHQFGSSRNITVGGSTVAAFFPPRTLKLLNCSLISSDSANGYIFNFINHPNVYLSNMTLINNGLTPASKTIKDFVYPAFLSSPLVYAKTLPALTQPFSIVGVVYGTGGFYALTYITAVNCSSARGALGLTSFNSADIHDLYLEGNACTFNWGSGLTLLGTLNSFELYRVTAVHNSCSGGRGAIAIFARGAAPIIIIRDSVLNGNFAQRSAGILVADALNVTITNVTFQENSATTSGGALTIRVSPTAKTGSFVITQCRFYGNSVLQTGTIFFESTVTLVKPVLITLQEVSFTSNWADVGSAVYIGLDLSLNSQSQISKCLFENNTSAHDGTVYLAYSAGSLTLDNCDFHDNTANQGSGVYAGYASSPTFLILSNTDFARNKGTNGVVAIPASLRRPSLQTYKNKYTNNFCPGVTVSSGIWTDSGSTFTNNTGSIGGAVKLVLGASANLTGTVFTANTASQYGGACGVSESSSLNCTACSATLNICGAKGGVFYIFNNSTMNLRDSLIINNTSKGQGAAFYLSTSPISSTLLNSTISNNQAGDFAAIVLYESALSISNSLLEGNTASRLTAGIQALMSTLSITKSTFRKQRGYYGGMIDASQFTRIEVSGSTFEDLNAEKEGGVISASQSVSVLFQTSTFSNIFSTDGGLIHTNKDCNVSFHSCIIQHCSSETWLLNIETGKLDISQTSFLSTNGAVIYSRDVSSFVFTDSSIEGVVTENSAIWCKDCLSVTLASSRVEECRGSEMGSGFRVSSTTGVFTKSVLTKMTFTGNMASKGGAVSIETGSLALSDSLFINNVATEEGGAISLKCDFTCLYFIISTEFRGNSASRNGGAIVWTNSKPILTNLSFNGNLAIYGNETASFPFGLQLLSQQNLTLTSGQIQTEGMDIAIVDHYGQIVSTDDDSVVDIALNTSAKIDGLLRFQVSGGVAHVSGFRVTAMPGTWVSLVLSPEIWGSNVSLVLPAYMRFCETGEYQSGEVCESCAYGYFSFSPDMECTRCPNSAECLGAFKLVPKAGYWRSSNLTTNILPCPNENACIGSPDLANVSFTGACAKGYYGNLCNGCELGYFRSEANVCNTCPSMWVNNLLMAVFCIILLLIAVLMIASSIRSATKPKSLLSIYIKIFMNYLQLVLAATAVDLNYPKQYLDFSKGQGKVGSVDDQVFSFSCYFDNPDSIESIQTKMLIIAIAPVLVTLLSASVWTIIKIIRRSTSYAFCKGEASVIILFFLLHPTITRNTFSQFDCMTIDPGERWLVTNLTIRCWEGTHRQMALTLALPCLIIWVISLPAVTLLYLATHRDKLDTVNEKLKFGFVINGYKKQRYFWEFVILYRKVIVVCFAVFLSKESTEIQALALITLLVLIFVLQNKNRPFLIKSLNDLEERALLVSAITIYGGLYFISNSLTSEFTVLLFAIIIIANVYFLSYWLLLVSGTSFLLLLRKWRGLRDSVNRIHVVSNFVERFEKSSQVFEKTIVKESFFDAGNIEDVSTFRPPPVQEGSEA